jgi:hypothetical protein
MLIPRRMEQPARPNYISDIGKTAIEAAIQGDPK